MSLWVLAHRAKGSRSLDRGVESPSVASLILFRYPHTSTTRFWLGNGMAFQE
jgi:hypothetical protein